MTDQFPGDNTNFIVEWVQDGESKMEHFDTESEANAYIDLALPSNAKQVKIVQQTRRVVKTYD